MHKSARLALLLFTSLSLLSIASSHPVRADISTNVVLAVQPYIVRGLAQGSFFQVNLTVSSVADLDGWQAKIVFTPSVLQVVDAAYPDPPSSVNRFCVNTTSPGSTGCYNTAANIMVDNTGGSVGVVGATNIPIPSQGPGGNGTLVSIAFKVMCSNCADTISLAPPDNDGFNPTFLRSVSSSGQIFPIPYTAVSSTFTNRANNPPVASFKINPPNFAKVDDTVSFNASASYGIDGPVAQYNWDFGDGTKNNVTSAATTHIFRTSATFTVYLVVVDSTGQSGSPVGSAYPITPKVVIERHPPLASFYSSKQGAAVGEIVTFYGNASYDPDGTVVSYTWNFGDGTGNTTLSTPSTTHAFAQGGVFTVTLTVMDNDGLWGSISHPEIIQALHDIGIVRIDLAPRTAFSGQTVSVLLELVNFGLQAETVDLEVYRDSQVAAAIRGVFVERDCGCYFVVNWNTTGTPPGNYTISARVLLSTDENPTNDNISDGFVIILPPPVIVSTPLEGAPGAKVLVHGSGFRAFPTYLQTIDVTFDDQFIGYTALNDDGTFDFTFSVPLSQLGEHEIHALVRLPSFFTYPSRVEAATSFTVTAPSPTSGLLLSVGVGAIYFPGETVNIYVLSFLQGSPSQPGTVQLTLLLPDGSTSTLKLQPLTPGLYRASYKVPTTGSIGTYALVSFAQLKGLNATAIASFEVKPTWLQANGHNIVTASSIAGTLGAVALIAVGLQKGYFTKRKDLPNPLSGEGSRGNPIVTMVEFPSRNLRVRERDDC